MTPAHEKLLQECKAAIEGFRDATSNFKLIRTVNTTAARSVLKPKTIFILDSSFNPPSRAHASLAASALAADSEERYPRPHRLLLLFSVQNADKAPVPAPFEHRLAMMVCFAQDLAANVASRSSSSVEEGQAGQEAHDPAPVLIDIGLTTKPYYHDKSEAIISARVEEYSNKSQHVHLVGFDTITRIFNPKYYPSSTPPLAALSPFFSQHGLRVTKRPVQGDASGEGAEQQARAQSDWVEETLRSGSLERHGAQREWSDRVEIVEADPESAAVSSTRIRQAVFERNWEAVGDLCSPNVTRWIREFGLYDEGE